MVSVPKNEASLALQAVRHRVSPQEVKSIARFIRFVHQEEVRARSEKDPPHSGANP